MRTFFAFDSQSLLTDAGSPFGLPGGTIINNSDTPNGTVFEFQSGFEAQMVTVGDDGGLSDRLEDDDEGNPTIVDGGGRVADGTPIEAESLIGLRALDAFGTPTGPIIIVTVLSQNGVTQDIWGFASDRGLSPGTRYVKSSAQAGLLLGASQVLVPAIHLVGLPGIFTARHTTG